MYINIVKKSLAAASFKRPVCTSRGGCVCCRPHLRSRVVLSPIHLLQENLYTKEEMKVTWETRKILDVPDMAVRSVKL